MFACVTCLCFFNVFQLHDSMFSVKNAMGSLHIESQKFSELQTQAWHSVQDCSGAKMWFLNTQEITNPSSEWHDRKGVPCEFGASVMITQLFNVHFCICHVRNCRFLNRGCSIRQEAGASQHVSCHCHWLMH